MSLKQCVRALGCALLILPSAAQAELLIAPTRVVVENGERSAELVLVNRGDEEAAYRISLENRRMLPTGALVSADDPQPDELFALEHVRYAPRRLVMAPGARQTVRVSASTAGLAPGEYRSHLRVMAAPTSAGRSLASAANAENTDGISIELVAIRSLTIPVILRVGELDAEVTLGEAALRTGGEGEKLLVAKLQRTGTKSAYGDLEITLAGEDEPLFAARGIAVYTSIDERDVTVPIPDELARELSGQRVRIAYVSADPAAPGVIADAVVTLN